MAHDLPTCDLIRFTFPGLTASVAQTANPRKCLAAIKTVTPPWHQSTHLVQEVSTVAFGQVLDNSIGDPSTPSLHSGTLEASQNRRSFQVISVLISPCLTENVCCIISNVLLVN